MDRKAVIILAVSFALLMVWYPLTNKLFPPQAGPKLTNAPGTVIGSNVAVTNVVGTNGAAAVAAEEVAPPAAVVVGAGVAETTLAIENGQARYTFTSHGGGLKLVELKNYPAVVKCRGKGVEPDDLASLNTKAPLPAMVLLGNERVQGDGVFELSRMGNGVRAEKTLTNGLRLVKEFRLGTNYLLGVTLRFENRSGQPLVLPEREWVIGTATPVGVRDESMMMGLQWFNGSKTEAITEGWFANRTLGCLPGAPRGDYRAGMSNVVWGAVNNQFFTMIALPREAAPQIVGRRVPLPPPSQAELAADPKAFQKPFGYQTSLVYPQTVLGANEGLERQIEVFAGPKEFNTLARLGQRRDLVMGFGGFFGFFAKALLLSMNGLHGWGIPYGLTIIVITVIIKLLFWPLTNASTKSMKRMAALQPQMKAIQEKYKDDPKKMNAKLMEFMRQNKVSPLGGCLPMLLQIPVFLGFYRMLQSAIELRGASFLWACDLSQPDTVAYLPGLQFPINPLPLIMGATMLWQARLTPPSPGMDPVQQKIMKYMPLMFMVFLYNFSAGLTLYWTVQNLLTIAQMKLTKSTAPAPAPGVGAKGLVPKKKM